MTTTKIVTWALVAFMACLYLGKVGIEYYFDRSHRRRVIFLQVLAAFIALQVFVYMVIYEN